MNLLKLKLIKLILKKILITNLPFYVGGVLNSTRTSTSRT